LFAMRTCWLEERCRHMIRLTTTANREKS